MSLQIAERFITKFLAAGLFTTTIFVAAWWTTEPVNAPKMLVLSMLAGSCLAVILLNFEAWWHLIDKVIVGFAGIFMVWITTSTLVSQEPLTLNFYGATGRNTGLLTYLCLIFLFLSALIITQLDNFKVVIKSFLIAGVFNLVYCLFSLFGIELLPWNNIYNTILGTFGNPNFIGAFLGMFFVAMFARLVSPAISGKMIALHIFLMALIFIEILKSHAIQGLAVSAIGVAFIVWLKIRSLSKSKILEFGYLFIALSLGTVATLGALQIGPLAKFIYKPSVSFRGQYWLAGWNMGVDNPIFGLGPDSYGSWYRRMRSPQSLITPGINTTSNAAHNVFIDIFSTGGFPLLVLYLIIVGFVVRSIIKLIRKSREFDLTGSILISVWLCYQAQSVISINQIGLAIWGWVFGGLIIAYQKSMEIGDKQSNFRPQFKNRKGPGNQYSEPALVVATIVGFSLGALVAIPPFLADAKWRTAMGSGDAAKIQSAAVAWPKDSIRLSEASTIFLDNKLPDQALLLSKLGIKEFPNSYVAWYTYAQMPNLTDAEKILIKSNLHRLDPLNPAYK